MKRQHNRKQVIELGRASRETRGGPQGMDDFQAGLFRWTGLSVD